MSFPQISSQDPPVFPRHDLRQEIFVDGHKWALPGEKLDFEIFQMGDIIPITFDDLKQRHIEQFKNFLIKR